MDELLCLRTFLSLFLSLCTNLYSVLFSCFHRVITSFPFSCVLGTRMHLLATTLVYIHKKNLLTYRLLSSSSSSLLSSFSVIPNIASSCSLSLLFFLCRFVGLLVQEFVHLPDKAFSSPLATEAFFQVPTGGLFQIFLFCGLCELIGHRGKVTYADMFTGDGKNRTPGELGFNPLGVKYDESMRLREIKVRLHGIRFATVTYEILISHIMFLSSWASSLSLLTQLRSDFSDDPHSFLFSSRFFSCIISNCFRVPFFSLDRMVDLPCWVPLVPFTRCSSTRFRSLPALPKVSHHSLFSELKQRKLDQTHHVHLVLGCCRFD